VSIILGLSAAGNDVAFYSDLCEEVGLLFPSKEIKVTNIIERMSRVCYCNDNLSFPFST